ncbi:phage shock protein PspA [Pleionea sediminis]|uniref:phage shock protein PspA n=1 Tax=Pleionea sediminis TaxID=2569479 RepID=UPI001184C33B|nr:phage shock protein PspA [Pleionea sediminis]
MSIFSRFADIINSNMNALLDKAEDPQKLIRMIIQEMEDTLVEVRTVSAKTLADKKELLRKLNWLESEIQDWQEKAELAVSKEREDLAKAALNEKYKLERDLSELSSQLQKLDDSLGNLTQEINQLQDKLVDARARQQTIEMRFNTQQSRVKVNRKLYDSSSSNVVQRFEQFERKLDELEAEAESFRTVSSRNLKAEINDLESDQKVDDELKALKEKVKNR